MREYLDPNQNISKDKACKVLKSALKASMDRRLEGHGYGAEKGLLDALNVFKTGGLQEFLESARDIFPEFHLLLWRIIDDRSLRVQSPMGIKGPWGQDHTEEWKILLKGIKPKHRMYLAYGSNMASGRMFSRCPEAKRIGSAYIEDWQLKFHYFANIEHSKGAKTPVVVWEISASDGAALDRCEGLPKHYQKENLLVTLNGCIISAMAYVMTDWKKKEDPRANLEPDHSYLRTIRQGYQEAGFNEKI